ncbi:hypothetical protein BDK51DRAFT_32502 [Blyttiomyces helicus]|uniref:Uncharacterized protein n=1 Tax=Blyttiomyces helicus TaxID=388810 RepID=A0A4P9W0D6_9FUNG|nr:hypothetical protein BDK51DRAFT_32502 [Blyttiomyces helicus]|eukprot:RKO84010.1 hypothetical protein BDK51DRAFT_32502 [Blyttiomyces helicus]
MHLQIQPNLQIAPSAVPCPDGTPLPNLSRLDALAQELAPFVVVDERPTLPPQKVSAGLAPRKKREAFVENISYNFLDALLHHARPSTTAVAGEFFEAGGGRERGGKGLGDVRTLLMHTAKAKIGVTARLEVMVDTLEMTIAADTVDVMRRIALSLAMTDLQRQHSDSGVFKVVLVFHQNVGLNGFAGLDSIYLNVHAWDTIWENTISKRQSEEGDMQYHKNLPVAFLIEAAILALHGFGHVLCHRITDDLNFSTPSFALGPPSLAGEREAGRLTEANLWGLAAKTFMNPRNLAWLDTWWLESWGECIQENRDLPPYEDYVGADDAVDCVEYRGAGGAGCANRLSRLMPSLGWVRASPNDGTLMISFSLLKWGRTADLQSSTIASFGVLKCAR